MPLLCSGKSGIIKFEKMITRRIIAV